MTRPPFLVVLALGLLAPGVARAGIADLVAAELRLRLASRASNDADLVALGADPSVPAVVRGEAACELWSRKSAPLSAQDRSRFLASLAEPTPEVRAGTLRALGKLQDRAIEGEALKRAALDADPRVRIEALRAVRPATRPGHLYYLQQALLTHSPDVQSESLKSLSLIAFRDLPPEILKATQAAAGSDRPTAVRLRALEALGAWGRLTWRQIRDVLLDNRSSDVLRLFGLEASDSPGLEGERNPILLGILASDPSPRLAWASFRRLRTSSVDEADLVSRTTQFLTFSPHKNAATEEMAAYLRYRGHRVEYRSGAWKVGAR